MKEKSQPAALTETAKRIKDVSEALQISKSALRYWEKKGLISLDRDTENEYRLYSKRSITEIQDFLVYRSLGIPLKDIKKINESSVELSKDIIVRSYENTKQEIEKLKQTLQAIENRMQRLEEYEQLKEKPYQFCHLDPMKVMAWEFDNGSMQIYLENPHETDLINIYPPSYDSCMEGLVVSARSDPTDIVWELTRSSDQYMAFLLKTEYIEPMKSDLKEHLAHLSARGFRTGTIVCKFLLSGFENGKKYDYFKAMAEIIAE